MEKQNFDFKAPQEASSKPLYADLSLDNQILKDLFTKKAGPSTKRQVAEELVADQGISVSRACRLVSFPRSKFYYRTRKNDKEFVSTPSR